MNPVTDDHLRARLEKLLAVDPQEIGCRAGEAASWLQEMLRIQDRIKKLEEEKASMQRVLENMHHECGADLGDEGMSINDLVSSLLNYAERQIAALNQERTRILEDYDRQKTQLRLCEEHAAGMARDFDAGIATLRAERDEARTTISKGHRAADIAEKLNDTQTEMEASITASFNEAMAHDVLEQTEKQRDEYLSQLQELQGKYQKALRTIDEMNASAVDPEEENENE